MVYLEYDFTIKAPYPASDILIAQLGEIGFESFEETDDGVKAYIQKKDFKPDDFKKVEILQSKQKLILYTSKEIAEQNWNSEWEKNFSAIWIGENCHIRGPFHPAQGAKFEIVIEPKMSFGTGHHETTSLMISAMMKLEFGGTDVLDMGCGTGVLAIMTEYLGAKSVDAIDIDNWCYLNSLENIERNNCSNINVIEGDSSALGPKTYDIILANINRNILLNDISKYVDHLENNGVLLLSGIYKEDIEVIEAECNRHMLKLSETMEKNNWVCLKFIF